MHESQQYSLQKYKFCKNSTKTLLKKPIVKMKEDVEENLMDIAIEFFFQKRKKDPVCFILEGVTKSIINNVQLSK